MKCAIVLLWLASAVIGFGLERTLESNGRIVGGSSASIVEYPYQVSVQLDGNHLCGGSLISANYVLTAAHCMKYLTEEVAYNVRIGSSIRSDGGIEYEIADSIVHEKFNEKESYDYDIALLLLKEPIPFSSYAQPVALVASGEEVVAGTPAVITGWGDLQEDGNGSKILQTVQVPIISNDDCSKVFSGITTRMICAGFISGGRDACQGDSGGPMVANGKQVGIVSAGEGCARPNTPGVYTKVSALRDWISEKSGI